MKIEYKNEVIEEDEAKKVIDIFEKEINDSNKNIIACRCNNEIKSLDYVIKEDSKVELLDYTNIDGKRIYVRGLIYILSKAIQETCKEALVTVNYQLSNAMFCEIDNIKVTNELLKKVDNRMKEIIEKDIPITKVLMTKEKAEEFYNKEKTLKGKLQLDMKQKDEVLLYYCEDYYNYFYGVMPKSTGYIKVYELIKYKDGFLVRYPSSKKPNQLAEFVECKKLLRTLDEYEDLHKDLNVNTIYKLNKAVTDGKIKDLILIDEALHEKKIADIANKISKRKEVKMVLIAGPSSSGKTTFAQRLGIQLRINGLKPVTISVDNYFVEREETPRDAFGKYDFESIDAIDLQLFNEHLTRLAKGEEIKVPTFDFTKGKKVYKGNTMKLEKDNILVIEGIHCLNDKLTSSIPKEEKYKIYISALTVLNIDYYNRISTTDTRLIRRIVRDYNFRGYSALHTLGMWDSVNRGEEKNIFPYQEEADSMFNSSLIYELGVLKNFAEPLLKEITNEHYEFSEAKRIYRFLSYFKPIQTDYIPNQSLIREFIGGSIFET